MRYLLVVIGCCVVALGTAGAVAPNVLVGLGRYSVTTIGLYVAAAARLGMGFLFLRVAPVSRTPNVLRVFGVIGLLGGLATALMGVDRARVFLDWGVGQGPVFFRVWGGGLAVIGAFIAYVAALGRRDA